MKLSLIARGTAALCLIGAIAMVGGPHQAQARIPSDEPVTPRETASIVEAGLKQAARENGTSIEDVSAMLASRVKINLLFTTLAENPNFSSIELRYNPARVAVFGIRNINLPSTVGGLPVEFFQTRLSASELQPSLLRAIEVTGGHSASYSASDGWIDVFTEDVFGSSNRSAVAGLTQLRFTVSEKPRLESLSGGEELSGGCTSAFSVGGAMITAGHCSANGSGTQTLWSGGSEAHGSVTAQNCENDIQVYSGAPQNSVRGTAIYGSYPVFNGDILWKYGRMTGWTSGTVFSYPFAYSQVGGDCDGTVTTIGLRLVGASSIPGDSGGPYVQYAANYAYAVAVGIHSASLGNVPIGVNVQIATGSVGVSIP